MARLMYLIQNYWYLFREWSIHLPHHPSKYTWYCMSHENGKWWQCPSVRATFETTFLHLRIPKIQRRPSLPTALTFYATDATCHRRWNFEVVPAGDTVYKCQIFLYSFDQTCPYLVCCSCHVCHISSYANATPRPRDDCAARGKPGIRWSR